MDAPIDSEIQAFVKRQNNNKRRREYYIKNRDKIRLNYKKNRTKILSKLRDKYYENKYCKVNVKSEKHNSEEIMKLYNEIINERKEIENLKIELIRDRIILEERKKKFLSMKTS